MKLSTQLKTTLALTALFLASTPTQAEMLGIGIGVAVWNAKPTGDVSTDITNFKIDDSLKSSNNNYFYAYFNHPIPVIPNLKLESTSFESEKSGDLLQLDQIDATIYWTLPIPLVDLDLGITAKSFDGKIQGSGINEKIDATVPMGYASLTFGIPATDITLNANTKVISYDGSSLNDTQIKARWDVISAGLKFGIEAGYRTQNIKIDGFSQKVKTDIKVDGFFAGIALSF